MLWSFVYLVVRNLFALVWLLGRPRRSKEMEILVLRTLAAVQASGEAWMSGTTWDGRRVIRISVSNWSTTDDDVERALAAFAAATS